VITFTQERSTGDRPLIDMPHDRLPDPERIREFEFPDPRSDFPVPISSRMRKKPDGHEYLGAGVEISGLSGELAVESGWRRRFTD
jgi:hypothetical protein